MNNIQFGQGTYSPVFTGKVDSSVKKYVTSMKKEAKKIYNESCDKRGIRRNQAAPKIIDNRCNIALSVLNKKAESLHKDTVIKAVKNPNKKSNGLYLVAENKGLLLEWEQKGAVNTLSVYNNDLRNVKNMTEYDSYITQFEGLVDNLNQKTLDKKMVRTSISNLWNMNIAKILKGKTAERYTSSTKQVASDIGYENTTFPQSLAEHFSEIREKFSPKEEKNKFSIKEFFKDLFLPQKKDKVSKEIRII